MPLVSVIMPTYNRAHLLPDVMNSILDQDFTEFELLIVDDCSTDQTTDLIQSLQEKDGRLRYQKLAQNSGIGYARQAGLELVSSRYIALADSDDIWLPGKLSRQIAVMEKYPEIDILFGDFLNINSLDRRQSLGFEHTVQGMNHLTGKLLEDDLFLVDSGVEMGILTANFLAVPTMLLRSSTFEKVGGFNQKLRSAADHEFGFRAALLGARFAYLQYPLIKRYVYPDSVTANKITSTQRLINALMEDRQLSLMWHRDDLVKVIDRRIYSKNMALMNTFGEAGQIAGVFSAYRKVVAHTFSLRDFAMFSVLLLGPKTVSIAKRLRRNL